MVQTMACCQPGTRPFYDLDYSIHFESYSSTVIQYSLSDANRLTLIKKTDFSHCLKIDNKYDIES